LNFKPVWLRGCKDRGFGGEGAGARDPSRRLRADDDESVKKPV
jgi:hypothetical protein